MQGVGARIDLMRQGCTIDLEPTTGIEPVNLFLTKEALYRLSYVGFLPKPIASVCQTLTSSSL